MDIHWPLTQWVQQRGHHGLLRFSGDHAAAPPHACTRMRGDDRKEATSWRSVPNRAAPSPRCPRLLLKRDDLTGLAFGGDKARKLEFLVEDALRAGATVLVTSGAVQSNHARMTAAAARAAGLGAALVLTAPVPHPPVQGNLLLDHLLGAHVYLVPANPDPALAVGDDAATIAAVLADLQARGERPYLIPVGGSSPVGVLGYVAGTLELVGQLVALGVAPSRLYYASGSHGTQAGLALGAQRYSAPYDLYGIAVSSRRTA